MKKPPHYLQSELQALVQRDPIIFEFLQGGSLDGVWYWDIENPEQEWMSDRLCKLLGQDPSTREHLAAERRDLIHPDDLALSLANFEAHCTDPDHPYDQVVRYKHPDGHWVWVRCRGLAIRDASGKVTRMLGAHNDITELKMAETRLRVQIRTLEAQNRSLQDFAFAASHDLQEPLRKLTAFSEILAEDLGDDLTEAVRYDLEVITDAAVRMRRLVDALLSLSRAGTQALDINPVALEPIARDAITEHEAIIASTGAEVHVEPLPMFDADRAWLVRLFSNLVDNALKYRSEASPQIRIVWDDQQQAVGVIDNGIGIDPRYHDTVFNAFKRLHARSAVGGEGLGLALCHQVVARHGGRIWVESTLGAGATFWFTLNEPA